MNSVSSYLVDAGREGTFKQKKHHEQVHTWKSTHSKYLRIISTTAQSGCSTGLCGVSPGIQARKGSACQLKQGPGLDKEGKSRAKRSHLEHNWSRMNYPN